MGKRGYRVSLAADVIQARAIVEREAPAYAIVDLRMPGIGGLQLVDELLQRQPSPRTLVLTGFGSIPSAIEALRLGACHYLSKPADTDEILAALLGRDDAGFSSPREATPSLARVEWEHIQRVLQRCDGNITQAAQRLGLHRRSLQRKLGKQPVQS